MKSSIHTILCWFLAMSLVWLPLTVSADVLESSLVKHNCHDMSSSMQHPMEHAVAMSNVMVEHESCNACAEDCTCNEVSQCAHRVSQVMPFIISAQFFSKVVQLTTNAVVHVTQYQSQIISPEYRPPVV